MKILWDCSLHRKPSNTIFPKQFSKTFLDFQTHPLLSLKTTRFIWSFKFWIKSFSNCENILKGNIAHFVPVLEYWQSDIRNIVFYKVSSRYENSHFCVTRGLVSFSMVCAQSGDWLKNQIIDFFHQSFDASRSQKGSHFWLISAFQVICVLNYSFHFFY